MKLTNNEIYNYTKNLIDAFQNKEQKFPIKINFYLQKNKKILIELTQDIENAKIEIAEKYGELEEGATQYTIPPEHMNEAYKDLEELFNIEQDVQIYKVKIEDFNEDLMLTSAQMEALMFMID